MPQGTPKKIAKPTTFKLSTGMFGGSFKIIQWEEEVTIAAAAYTDSSANFPAYCLPLSCTARVKTAIAGGSTATVFNVGISGNTNKFTPTTTVGVAAGSTGGGMSEDHALVGASAIAVRLTPDQTPATGKVILHGVYELAVAPTSSVKK